MGTTVNSVTGDLIKTKIGNQKAYEANWDAIFGKKDKQDEIRSDNGADSENSEVASD